SKERIDRLARAVPLARLETPRTDISPRRSSASARYLVRLPLRRGSECVVPAAVRVLKFIARKDIQIIGTPAILKVEAVGAQSDFVAALKACIHNADQLAVLFNERHFAGVNFAAGSLRVGMVFRLTPLVDPRQACPTALRVFDQCPRRRRVLGRTRWAEA